MSNDDDLRARLKNALRPRDKSLTLTESANEMCAVHEDCKARGINYSKLLSEVCFALSVEKKA